jgi:hypothetical protein
VPPPHIHRREDEAFYVLEGQLCFHVDGRDIDGGAGSWGSFARGSLHYFENVSDRPARMLIEVTPAGLEWFSLEVGRVAWSWPRHPRTSSGSWRWPRSTASRSGPRGPPESPPAYSPIGGGTSVGRDGRFRIEGLVPGLKYPAGATEGSMYRGDLYRDVTVAPSEVKDLGDLKIVPRQRGN